MTPLPDIKQVVVFDLGNVLIRWDPRNLYRSLFGEDSAQMEWFLANVCTAKWNAERDAGEAFADGIRDLSHTFPTYAAHIAAYYERWPEMLGGPISENVSLLLELRRSGVPLYALTNWSHETFPWARERYPFLNAFDGIVVSGEERLIKPDPRLYQVLFTRYDLNPKSCIFIDDTLANVKTALDLGMSAIHYASSCDLRSHLRSLGLVLSAG